MNEITRIHLARVAYDAELEAKKELEAYERALRQHLEDAETFDDIEVRMSELLAERGVKAGGVITLDDVKAIRKQLGEPSEFGEEQQTTTDTKPVKRLYRDLDNAILGGVMSGIAAYFRLDPTLVRIVGVLLIALSFGMFLLAYVLLWLLVPAAKTASQRLELMGKAPTVENINATGEMRLSLTAKMTRRVLSTVAGLGAVGVAVLCLVVVARVVLWNPQYTVSTLDFINNPALFVAIAGVVFAMFMSVIAYGLIRRTWRRQFTFALLCMTIVGFVTFGMGAYGFIVQRYYSYNDMSPGYSNATQKSKKYTAPNMTGVKKLVVDSNVPVFYSIGQPSMSVAATNIFEPTFTVSGDTATLHFNHSGDAQIFLGGPALDSIEVMAGGLGYTAEGGTLSVVMAEATTTTVRGSLDSLQVTLRGNGTAFNAEQLVVNSVKMTKTSDNSVETGSSQAWFANIGSLDVTYPVSCTSSSSFSVSVNNVAGSLMGNGQAIALPSQASCFELLRSRG